MLNKNIEVLTLNKKNINNFAFERNNLLKITKKDWVLFLDTDEVITPDLEEEMNRVVDSETDVNGFYIKRKIYFLGKKVGEDRVLRLAKVGTGKWKRKVHEVWEIRGKVRTLNSYIIHNTARSVQEFVEKINKYSTIHAEENLKEGKRSSIVKIIFYPYFKFLQNFILGRGFIFSVFMAFHSFLSWTKQWQLQKD